MTTLLDALQAAAAAEDAAIYGYSVAGARLRDRALKRAARADYDVHRAQFQAVTGWLAKRAGTPSPPPPVYELARPITDDAAATALLTRLEEACCAAYADVVAVATGDVRRAAALALQSAAVRESRWRGKSVPFPGLVGRLPT
ncbi:MAG TPA: DUF4439 domain-containing protein [Acidothermaceae bacterium]|jgi:hypothetical protein